MNENEADAILVIVWMMLVATATLSYQLQVWLFFGVACWSGGIVSRDLVGVGRRRYRNHKEKK